MKSRLSRSYAIASALVIGIGSGLAFAETVYISDELTVPLRSGPGNAYRILHRGLPSGTKMDVLSRDEESGFTQIRTDRGTEGWVPTQYLVSQPIARDRLVVANREIERLNTLLKKQETQLTNVSREKGQAEQSSNSLERQVAELEKELANIKQISAGAIEEHATNQRLTELNERLRTEVESLVRERDALQDDAQQRWLLIGGGLVLAGLLLGVVIKARPRRSAWT